MKEKQRVSSTEVIIVKFNLPEYEKQCVGSVVFNTSNYNLTVYNNYPQNENLGKLWNRLIKRSNSKYICLLNSDAIVFPNWLEKLLFTFSLDSKIGIVGPTTNSSRNHQSLYRHKHIFVDYGQSYPKYCLSGFCLVFPKKIWKKVGGFPEDFGFYGQDVIFIDKIMKAGYKQIWRTDVFVYHKGSASVRNSEMDEKKERLAAQIRIKKERKTYEN